MFRLSIEFEIRPEKRKEFLLGWHGGPGIDALPPRCCERSLWEKPERSGPLLWQEAWTDGEALATYLASNAFQINLSAIRLLGQLRHMQAKMEEDPAEPVDSALANSRQRCFGNLQSPK